MSNIEAAIERELRRLIEQRCSSLMTKEELDLATRRHMCELGYWLAGLYMAGHING